MSFLQFRIKFSMIRQYEEMAISTCIHEALAWSLHGQPIGSSDY